MTDKLFNLDGRVAVVTGASSGLGRHFALTLARAGAKVALAARRVDELEKVAAEIGAFDARALPIAFDVTNPSSVKEGLDAIQTELGPICIVVNNAGIAATTSVFDQTEEEWRRIIDTNLDGAWRVARAAAGQIALNGHGGSIINIASILGLRPASHVAAYAASKAALISLTQTMAVEFARHRIRVNALAPGYIETDLNREFLHGTSGQSMVKRVPLRRFGDPGDLEGALLLLASDAGRYMTGSTIVVDGGHSLGFL
jgi:NAD(P)-dependent dehydrogenase (short-subunit alcohol dehydrogenase family)